MREIKFRGKSSTSGEWKTGCLWLNNEQALIIPSPLYDEDEEDQSVIRKTVGQFTGLKDMAGVDIFEGDILRVEHGQHYWEYVVDADPYNPSSLLYAVETYHNVTKDETEEIYTYERSDSKNGMKSDVAVVAKQAIIIGNIHDNQDLLS